MGLFDEVYFRCPACAGSASIQSKAGNCSLASFPGHAVPTAIAGDILGKWADCDNCGRSFRIVYPDRREIPDTVALELER